MICPARLRDTSQPHDNEFLSVKSTDFLDFGSARCVPLQDSFNRDSREWCHETVRTGRSLAARRLSAKPNATTGAFSSMRFQGSKNILGDSPLGAAFDQDLMTNDMYLVHPEHPFQRTPELLRSASPPSGPQVDQFPSGEWITFRAARPSSRDQRPPVGDRTQVSRPDAVAIRAGRRRPHARHWLTLSRLVGLDPICTL